MLTLSDDFAFGYFKHDALDGKPTPVSGENRCPDTRRRLVDRVWHKINRQVTLQVQSRSSLNGFDSAQLIKSVAIVVVYL